jgi:hypothetical protein
MFLIHIPIPMDIYAVFMRPQGNLIFLVMYEAAAEQIHGIKIGEVS